MSAHANSFPWRRQLYLLAAPLGALFVLPFVLALHRPPVAAFQQEVLSAGLLGFAMVSVLATHRTVRPSLQWPLPIMLLALLVVAGWHFGSGHLAYTYSFITLVMAVLLILCAYAVGRTVVAAGIADRIVRAIAVGTVAGAALNAVVQWMQLTGASGLPPWVYFEMARSADAGLFRPVGNVGQANQLATLLAMGVACLFWYRLPSAPARRTLLFGAVALLGSGVALSGSRMGMLMIFGLSVLQLLVARAWPAEESGAAQKVAALGIGLLAGAFGGPLLDPEVSTAVSRVTESSYGFRAVMWRDAILVSAQHPLLGVGVGEYGQAQYWIAQRSPFTQGTPNVHNILLQTAVESGAPLAIGTLLLIGWWTASDIRSRASNKPQRLVWTLGCLILIHAMLEWPLHVMTFAIPASVLWGLGEPEVRSGALRLDARRVLPVIAVALLSYVPLMLADYRTLAESTERIGDSDNLQGVVSVVSIGNKTFFKPYAERNLLRIEPPKRPVNPESIAMAERVLSRSPDAGVVAHYILLLALADEAERAVPHVERMRVFALSDAHFERLKQHLLEALAANRRDAQALVAVLEAVR